jgi:CheY-like chemotaxis protein
MNTITIVLVEDDDGHARLVEINLRRAGVTNPVIRCADGASAVECLFGGGCSGPLLILLDLNLPDMSGIDILQRLKADTKLRRAPVVVLTTSDDRAEVQRCYDLGCNIFITKPVDYEHFANAVRQLGLFFLVVQIPETA